MDNRHYKLRITLTHCDIAQCVRIVEKQSKSFCYGIEKGKQGAQPHVHFYLITNKKEDTMRTQYRKLSKSAKGNQLYSLKKMHFTEGKDYAMEYLAYCQKELDFHKEFFQDHEDWLLEAGEYDFKVKEDIKTRRVKKESRTKRIFQEFEEHFGDSPNPYLTEITEWVMDFFVKEKCNVSVQTLTSWTNTLCLNYLTGDASTSYRSIMSRKILDTGNW